MSIFDVFAEEITVIADGSKIPSVKPKVTWNGKTLKGKPDCQLN